jgi:peroxiredoxin/uncharacterized membrane protein YphA (DoxX/SURF4 family)
MEITLLVARVLLAAVFVVAGLAKLADRAGSRQAVVDFGVPSWLAPPLGVLLPLAELAVAVALIPRASAWYGALGALVLLLLFVAGIGVSLARGRRPACHCFGQLSAAPVGWATLVRNGLLAALAGLVVWQGRQDPGAGAVSWLGHLTPVQFMSLIGGAVALGLLVLVGLEGWALFNLLRQNGRLLLRVEALEARLAGAGAAAAPARIPAPPEPGLPVGTPAPAFSLPGLYGETLTLEALRAAGKPVLLVFSDPHCSPCNALLPELGAWQRDHAARLTVAHIRRGTPEANRAKSTEHGLTNVLLQQDREVAAAYQAFGTPGAVIVNPDGTVGSPLALGADAIRALVARTVGTQAAPAAPAPAAPAPSGNGAVPPAPTPNGAVPPVAAPNGAIPLPVAPASAQMGQPAPALRLPDLDGRMVDLATFRGARTLVLFWNPGCGFCRQMLDALKAWEANPPAGAPKLLVVSTGTVDENRALGLRAPVVLDQGSAVMRAFGANGTPMAVLVDAEGRIASQVAAGAPAVLALAGAPQAQASAPAKPPAPRIGDPAPTLRLPDLNGNMVNLAHLRGARRLVLFWNPNCGFCRQMLDELKAWEANPPARALKLLVVSTGTVEENRAMGLRAPVVLDQGSGVMSAFGANGTPMAVLVDAHGRIASELAAGAAAVLALARGEHDPVKVS